MRPTEPSKAEQRAEMDELAQLLKRAEAGDRSVLPQLQRALDGNPDLWRGYGDLAAHAEASLAMLAAGPNLLLAESLRRKLAELKAELGGESPSPPLQPLLAVADEGVGTRRPALGPGQPHQVGPAAGHEVDLPEDQGGADDHRPRVAGRPGLGQQAVEVGGLQPTRADPLD